MPLKFNPFTGNLDYYSIPKSTPNQLAWFNSLGLLESLAPWSVDPDLGLLSNITSVPGGDSRATLYPIRYQANLNGTVTGIASFLDLDFSGAGFTENIYGIDMTVSAPINTDLYLLSLSSSSTVGGSARGISIALDTPVTNDMTLLEARAGQPVGGNFQGLSIGNAAVTTNNVSMVSLNYSGTTGINFYGFSSYSNGTVAGDFRHIQLGNDGPVAGNSSGVVIFDNNNITQSNTGFGYYHNGNIGSGANSFSTFDQNIGSGTIDADFSGFNLNSSTTFLKSYSGLNINNSGTLSSAGLTGVALHNTGVFTTSGAYARGMTFNNQAAGYGLVGYSVTNDHNMSDSIQGFHFNSNGNSRTSTALDVIMSGIATDDVQGIRLNMSGQSSTNQEPTGIQVNMPLQTQTGQHVAALSTNNGVVGFNSQSYASSNGFVETGNNFSITTEVKAGSPLTNTDLLLTLIQSNLLVNDDIASGPIGLDTNMLAAVSQLSVNTGKTVPLLRSFLLGTSVPQGSGGTVTEHVVLELLGLPSFGGSVTNPTRVGIQDSILLGQNFSDGATDVWGIRWRDVNSEHSLSRLALNTASMKCSSKVRLEINDGHIRSTQTTPPTITPDTNAGTGATTSILNATDSAGFIELVTGVGPFGAGPVLAVTFDQPYNVAPIVVIYPANAQASADISNNQIFCPSASTTQFTINFGVAPILPATTYRWNYFVIETQ